TQPNVNPDQVFAGLDADSRRYLAIVANAGGRGLDGRGPDLRRLIQASYPTLQDADRLTRAIADRRAKVARLVSNLERLSHAAASKDSELTGLVKASSDVLSTMGAREQRLGAALDRLPGAVGATRAALGQIRPLATELGPAATQLRPMARELGPALTAARPLLRQATPVVRDHLRPLVRATTPLLADLRPSVTDLNKSLPPLVSVGRDLNYVANELLYNPPGPEEGYLFWTAWFIHDTDSMLSVQDAQGSVWRGLLVVGCSTLKGASAAICPKGSGG